MLRLITNVMNTHTVYMRGREQLAHSMFSNDTKYLSQFWRRLAEWRRAIGSFMKSCYWHLRLTFWLGRSCNCFLQSLLTEFFCLVHDFHSRPQIPPICKSCVGWSGWSQTSSSFTLVTPEKRTEPQGGQTVRPSCEELATAESLWPACEICEAAPEFFAPNSMANSSNFRRVCDGDSADRDSGRLRLLTRRPVEACRAGGMKRGFMAVPCCLRRNTRPATLHHAKDLGHGQLAWAPKPSQPALAIAAQTAADSQRLEILREVQVVS